MKEIGTSSLWTEKYRPKTLEDYICTDDIRNLIKTIVDSKEVPCMLLYGLGGTGKTTLAQVIANEIESDLLYINGSLETSVETIRYKVQQFVMTSSMFGGKKLVVFDECLDVNEEIVLSDDTKIKLKDMEFGKIYETYSLNLDTNEIETDTCELISERVCDIYEVELEDGRMIRCSSNHPFIVRGNKEKSILDGLSVGDSVIVR